MKSPALRLALCVCGLAALLGGGGCASGAYILRQAGGQVGVLVRTRAIDEVLREGRLEPEALRKLRLVAEARDFARDALGLRAGTSYRRYHETHGRPLSYNVSAARRESLTPYQWTFPIVGRIDYIGYFDKRDAERAVAALQAQGYDTVLRGVDAYSTLGFLPDPVASVLLQRDDLNLVDTVIHEIAHNTVYARGQSTFNESLATFIGRMGARRFYEARGDAAAAARLEQRAADQGLIDGWLHALIAAARAHYAGPGTAAEKVATREKVFQAAREAFSRDVRPRLHDAARYAALARIEANNAYLLQYERYHLDLDTMRRVFDAGGGDMQRFIARLREAARSADPFAALRE